MIDPPRLPALEDRDGWESRWQLTLIEPTTAPPEFDVPVQQLPRCNAVVARSHTADPTSEAAAERFLAETAPLVSELQTMARRQIKFNDGTSGYRLDVQFRATSAVTLKQAHLFRLDDSVLTQIVVTADTAREAAEFEDVVKDALSYTPLSPAARASP